VTILRDDTGKRDETASSAVPGAIACEGVGARTPRVVSSDALLRGDAQLAILHEQTLYFLRRTRFGKLILTK
jgi:hemin uptake protein HemP